MPLDEAKTETVEDIDALLAPTHDEYARQRAAAVIHSHTMLNLRFDMREVFERDVLPDFIKEHGRAPETGHEIMKAMQSHPYFKFYSSIRYNAMEMQWASRMPAIERALPDMIEVARKAAELRPAGGSLRLDPSLDVPRYVAQLDTHLSPGSFYSEFTEDDVAVGVLQGRGLSTNLGKGRVSKSRNFGGIGESIAYWLTQRYPDFEPKRVLDMGTMSGANLTAIPKVFPGIEAYGIDIAAPNLRYGHAKAEAEGIPIHFSQQNAEDTDFEDGFFDFVTSSFFLHEIPVASTRKVLKEAHRLLRPGGVIAFMELPPHKACDPFMNFAYDWDTRFNNEPFYATYRSQDPTELLVEAGFDRDACFEILIPDVTTFDMARYPDWLAGKAEAPPHGRGGWFILGARKAG